MHHPTDAFGMNERVRSIELLNKHLAAAIDLHAQLKQARWNVRGPNFMAIHELFDRIAERVAAYAESIARRAGAHGGAARGTIQRAAEWSFLPPYPLDIADENSHLSALSVAMAIFAVSARDAITKAESIGDPCTADVFREIRRGLDSELWLLEAHQPPSPQAASLAAFSVVRF